MIKRKLLIVLFFLTVSSFFIFKQNVLAVETATVTATITVQNISVTVSDGSVAYGTLGLNASAGTNPSDTQTVTNNGNISENINIKGQDSSSWTLNSTAGSNQYVHQFCVTSCGTPPTSYTALTTNYQTLASGISSSGTQTFDLYITTPTSSTSFDQQSVDVTIQAVAP